MSKLTGLWGHTDFLKLWAGQTLSALSSNVTDLALPLIAALVLHASAFEMGLLLTVVTLPDLLLGLFAGVWADRVRRRPIMIAADASRALLLLSLERRSHDLGEIIAQRAWQRVHVQIGEIPLQQLFFPRVKGFVIRVLARQIAVVQWIH